MAAGIQDLGNGLGYLYKRKSGGAIVSVERNTQEGVRAMQQMGVTNAPVAAQRSAYGIITVTASGGTGDITNVTILGVNQIAANITVTSTNLQTVANQIAQAINSYTAPGFVFTANIPNGAVPAVYVYSAPANGTAVNGASITIASTDPGLTFSTEDFVNGSNDNGVFDDQFGYQFYLDADYGGIALPNSIGLNAIEITAYMTVRGMQSGIITITRNIALNRIILLNRACAFTQVLVDTGGPATANLAFIDPTDFIEGDTIRLRNVTAARVTTLVDANVTTLVPTPNIYLSDSAPFTLNDFDSITLQYRYDAVLGPIWCETGRSITNSPITVTVAQFGLLYAAGLLEPGARYFVSDLSTGVYIYAIDGTRYEESGILRRYIPINYNSCWRPTMAAPVLNGNYRYYQRVYKSLTGVVGTAPDTDAVNWQVLQYTVPGAYLETYNQVTLSQVPLLNTWPITSETDADGNTVTQTYDHFVSSGVNAFNAFGWNQTMGTSFYGNTVINSVFDCANSDGQVYNNFVINSVNFSSNTLDSSSVISNNTLSNGCIITGNIFRSFSLNNVSGGLVQNNGVGANKAPRMLSNQINSGYIIGNTSTSALASIENNTIFSGSSIQLNTLNSAGVIGNNVLENTSQIQNCTILNTVGSHIYNNNLNNYVLEFVQYAAADVTTIYSNQMLNGAMTVISIATSTSIFDNSFVVSTISNWRLAGASGCTFTNCNIVTQLNCQFNNCNITNWEPAFAFNHTALGVLTNATVTAGVSSNVSYTLDLDDPTILAANVLTFPYNTDLGGEFNLTSAVATHSIHEIVGLPNFQRVRFYNSTLGVCSITFQKVAAGSWSGDLIAGAANFVLDSNATGVSDLLEMAKYQGAVNMIIHTVNMV